MTHNCVSSTVRAALDLGLAVTLAGEACATRHLPSPLGVISAEQVQRIELAALADRHACVVNVAELFPSYPPALAAGLSPGPTT
jgi:nicotinamidase-related amidase